MRIRQMNGGIDLPITIAPYFADDLNCGCYKRPILTLPQDAETPFRWDQFSVLSLVGAVSAPAFLL
jgi:hypothetical protein